MGNHASCISNARNAIAEQESNEREMGQRALREIITSHDGGDPDWAAIIRKAEELHNREQALIQQRSQRKHLARESKKRRRKELARRKKEDASGSFSVNLITYKPTGDTESVVSSDMKHSTSSFHQYDWASTSGGEQSLAYTAGSSTCDHSYSSKASDTISDFNFSRSCEEGMVPIDENGCLPD